LNDKPVVVKGYNQCLLCESYETHNRTVYARVHKMQMVHTAASVLLRVRIHKVCSTKCFPYSNMKRIILLRLSLCK